MARLPVPDLPPGVIRPVVTAPNPVLATVSATVRPDDPEVVQLAADLLATMVVSPGCVGLAANQVGVAWRVFCVDVTRHPKTGKCHGSFVLVNPVVVAGQLPGTGDWVELVTDAFEARALQHELDHVDGLLFLDRVAGSHAIHPRRRYQ